MTRRSTISSRKDGALLVITLWLVAIVSMVAIAVARSLSLEVRLAKYRLAREQARTLARSGIYLAMQRLTQDAQEPEADGKVYDWLGDDWASFPTGAPEGDPAQWIVSRSGTGQAIGPGDPQVRIRITDEARKLPLNAATKEALARLIEDDAIAQAIIDARDEPDAAEDRPSEEPPYFAKNGPFAALEELVDLPGMTPEALQRLAAEASPYQGTGEPANLNTVTPDTLRAMGLTESAVQLIVQFREGPDGASAHEEDGVFQEAGLAVLQTLKDRAGVDLAGTADGNLLISAAFSVTSQTFRVSAEGVIAHPPVRSHVEAVVRRSACGEGNPAPCIVAWREG